MEERELATSNSKAAKLVIMKYTQSVWKHKRSSSLIVLIQFQLRITAWGNDRKSPLGNTWVISVPVRACMQQTLM